VKLASSIIAECHSLGFGVITDTAGSSNLVLPPRYTVPGGAVSPATECGHIPKWLRQRLVAGERFSDYLHKCFVEFNDAYEQEIADGLIAYDDESALLIRLAQRIAKGDRRLFVPLGLLETLKQWERSGSNPKARDHFFHTFNNLFAGYLILGELAASRGRDTVPERYFHSAKSDIRSWEILWALTALFHDPGYIAEHFWSTFAFSLGLEGDPSVESEIPELVVKRILNAWDTDFAEARRLLIKLFERVSGTWDLDPESDVVARFDPALQRAYFNGRKCGHSLASGLYLITQCLRDRAQKHKDYDKAAASKACVIAALGMMFHDPYCRQTLQTNGIAPIPFELLPYASTLMFVDAIQDDRRDIRTSSFPAKCIFEELAFDGARGVVATVDIRLIEMKHWPGKIVEYEDAMRWINAASATKFTIDYRTRLGFPS
jgi:hypothetical protein